MTTVSNCLWCRVSAITTTVNYTTAWKRRAALVHARENYFPDRCVWTLCLTRGTWWSSCTATEEQTPSRCSSLDHLKNMHQTDLARVGGVNLQDCVLFFCVFFVWKCCYRAITVCKIVITGFFKNISTEGPTNCWGQKRFYSTFRIGVFGNTTDTGSDVQTVKITDEWTTCVLEAARCIEVRLRPNRVNCCNKTLISVKHHIKRFVWM